MGLRVVSEAEFWGEITRDRLRIVVAGSHGKTTTASLIAFILKQAGRNPGYRLGMAVPDLGGGSAWGSGKEFVFEGDEYTSAAFDSRPKFSHFAPRFAILTSVDWDHPDVFPNPDSYEAVFRQLVESLRPDDWLLANHDDEVVRALLTAARAEVQTYGLREGAEWQAHDVFPEGEGMRFTAWHEGKVVGIVTTRIPGEHNVSNALAALATAIRLAIPVQTALDAIGRFRGARRRFEVRGKANGITVVDDYAHHPTEVGATIRAAINRFRPGRVLACFVPHTYSRTRSLLDGYSRAFDGAALVLIGPIEPARERSLAGTIAAQDVVDRIQGVGEKATVQSADEAANRLASAARPGDVIVCMSVRGFDDVVGKTLDVLGRSRVG
jgi:UDP-N-acetylmuramate:L-alanyl-gamma-D-glutamyl-meso-diaminopimelate ligase